MQKNQEANQLLQAEYRIFGEKVKSARTLLGEPANAIAERANLSVSKMSRIENAPDSYPIADDELTRLALALGVSRNWLLEKPRAVISAQSMNFRKTTKMKAAHMQTVAVWETLMAELIDSLSSKVRFMPVSLPSISPSEVMTPETAAIETRKALGINTRMPVDHIIRAAEKLGVFVQTHDFDDELHLKNHDASSTWASLASGPTVPLMMVRTHSSWERTRFSVAHELGHLVMHRYGGGVDKEIEANRFAGEFLFPANTLWEEAPEPITLASLLPLKLKWGMSLQALVMNLRRAGIIDELRKKSLIKQLSARKNSDTGESWRTREPGADDRRVERPMMLGSAIGKAYGKPPRIDELLAALPTEHNNWYKSMLINFDLQWSKDLNAEMRLEAAEKQLRMSQEDNVVSFAQFRAQR